MPKNLIHFGIVTMKVHIAISNDVDAYCLKHLYILMCDEMILIIIMR